MIPSEPCTEDRYVRRVFLDTIGRLPTPEEVQAFLTDHDPEKRSHSARSPIDAS